MHRLANGTYVALRPILPTDKDALARGMSLLSDESKRKRFLTAKPRLTSAELRYLTEVDANKHVAIVAVPADDPEWIVGVARFVRLDDAPDAAEFAIIVAD